MRSCAWLRCFSVFTALGVLTGIVPSAPLFAEPIHPSSIAASPAVASGLAIPNIDSEGAYVVASAQAAIHGMPRNAKRESASRSSSLESPLELLKTAAMLAAAALVVGIVTGYSCRERRRT